MKKNFRLLVIFSLLVAFFTGCDNFMNSNEDFKNLMETEIDYAKAPLVNVLVGHNNDDYGTVGTGVVNYSVTAKVGYAFEVSFAIKATAGNFVGWNAYTKYDPDVPANCVPLDESYIEFLDNSRGKQKAKVKILKETTSQIRLVPEVSAFPVMEVVLPSELIGITPVPVSFNPPQPVKALTPGQEYSITATTTVDYGFSENSEECWKVYRKDTLGNVIEIANGDKITIIKNSGTQLANGRSQSTILITVDQEFSGRFYVSPQLIRYPSMNVEIEGYDTSLVKLSHSGTVSMAQGTPYAITLQTDPSTGFAGWKLCKRDNITLTDKEILFPADSKTTTNIDLFTPYSDTYIDVYAPSYEVTETGKSSGRVNASITIILKEDISDLDYSYFLLPQFFKYPVVTIHDPDNYSSAGTFSLTGPGYIDGDTVRMMMNDYEYTLTYKTKADYSFANSYWLVYESSDTSKNLLEENDSRIEITKSSIVTDESGVSTCSVSVILRHNFGTTLNIQPVVVQKPSMNIAFAQGTPNGINLSLGGTSITSGSVDNTIIKMATGKIYTATVNVPKGYSFEGWRLVRINGGNSLNWITESTKSTTEAEDSADLQFDSTASSDNPGDYVRIFNAKYDFQSEGRNAGTTKATVDVLFKKELSQFSLSLIPVIKAVPEISFAAIDSENGTLTPAASDVRNLYTDSKIDLSFKSTSRATAGTQIWKISKWDSSRNAYAIDYSANVGYTSQDLTAALNDEVLKTKDIIIYNNDNEGEVQPNSKGEYITTKTAVLYVNRMPDANLQLSVTPEVYNTIKFVPGTDFEATAFDSEVYIPADVTFNYELKTKAGYKFISLGTIVNKDNTSVPEPSQTTSYDGVSTVTGTITSNKNNGDAVVVTPEAAQLNKLYFGKPVLSTIEEKEDAGTMIPADTDFIYQVTGNSTSIRFETSGEYTFENFAAISEKRTNFLNVFYDIDNPSAKGKYYVFTTGTLAQAKEKIPTAKLIIHDLVETYLTDSQGQAKKRVTGTLTIVNELTNNFTIKPVVKAKPSFAVSLDNAEKGSVSPSTAKAILINEDYNISYISSSGYGFEKWSVTEDGTVVPVLTLDEAKGTAGTSATSFVVDLGSVQELTGANTVENVKTALGSNSTNLLAVIYNSSKVESQATEGVETATAKFRIVKDVASTIVVSPVTYKHSYFYLHLKNSADGRFSPISRTLMKAGKDYDFEFVFNEDVYTINEYSLNSASTFSSGTAYGTSACAQLSDLPISNWSDYESKKFVIYDDTISVNESNNVVTRKGKIRLIKEQTDGVEIHIRPSVFLHNKISLKADTDKVSKIQINDTISTTGSINSYTMIDHKFIPYKSYSISATPVSGKAIYENPEKMWILSNDYSDDLYEYYGSFEFTNGNYTDCDGQEAVFYNCRLEYVGDNLYKACADVIINNDEIHGFTIKPNVYTMPEFYFNPPVMTDGTKKGTCTVTKNNIQQTGNKVFLDTEYSFTYEAEDGNHISSLELYDDSGNLKKTFGKTDESYTDDDLKITDVLFYNDMKKITGKITFLTESVNGYSFKCNVSKGKPGPVLNIGTSMTYAACNAINYGFVNDSNGITQSNSNAGSYGIYATQEFDLEEAQTYGYQGKAVRRDAGYHIAEKDSIKFFINAAALDSVSTHQISKVKITERLMYLHPGMVFDYSPEHDYSQYDVIGKDGLQLYDQNGNYMADSKYKNAGFKFEESTILKVTDLSDYSKPDNTISGYTAYSNKIPYGGIHQYTVSVLDTEGNESNQFVAYLDVPRTPRTSAEIKVIKDLTDESHLWDEGLVIDWPTSPYSEGTEPLNENMRIVYSAGQIQTSTTECDFSSDEYHTYLRLYPSNSTFTFKICLSDSNGYATEFMESKEVISKEVNIGNLVVKDSDTFKFYYISVDQYLKNKSKLEPVAVIVRTPSNSDTRVIGAGLYDVGDYPFTNSNIWFNASNSSFTTSTDGKVMMNTWKTNAPYYSATPRNESNKTVLFTESNFPAIYKATHYWDIYKTVSGKLCNGWYLPGVGEIPSITRPNYLKSINRALRLIDGQLFEYNSDYWSADYAQPDAGGPRCKTLCTPESESDTEVPDYGLIYSTEIHHVRAVFDFTDLAEPWPNE